MANNSGTVAEGGKVSTLNGQLIESRGLSLEWKYYLRISASVVPKTNLGE
jgi:hypothetical protein